MINETMTQLVNGEKAFPEIIRCIENAATSVEINMFIWRDDSIGNRMAEAVLRAADNGAQVYISVDRYGVVLEKCEETKRSFFHKTLSLSEKAKVLALEWMYPENGRPEKVKDEETAIYKQIMAHPNIRISADEFKADHSKYYIIDDEILFVGGINIEDKENGRDISGRVYGDYMVKLCGREWVEMFRTKLRTGENMTEDVFFGINLKKPVRRFEMEQLYLDMIAGAKKELHITMAYFSPLKKFVDAIIAAHHRGVRVTVIIPEKANFQNDSNRRAVSRLLKASNGEIKVYLSPKMLHTKMMMNDGCISLGSTNITKKAFSQLNELNLFVRRTGSEFEAALCASIHDDVNGARRVKDDRQIGYNRLVAFLEGFLV